MSIDLNDLKKEHQELSDIDSNEHSLVDEFLMNQPKEIQRRVRKTVEIWGIDKNDPYFLILLQCRITQILYELVPNEIQQSHDNGTRNLVAALEKYKQDLFLEQEVQIEKQQKLALNIALAKVNTEIAKVMENNNVSYHNRRFSPRTVGSMVTATTILITGLFGFLGSNAYNKSLAENRQIRISFQDQELIKWAKSDEGQLAKKIMGWNRDIVDRKCEQKVSSLGITFRQGSGHYNSGFCVLFVAPEEKRNFNKATS